ncbi:p10 [Agrotis segetum nucleopolyhedrovirus B]|uniref:p10 n=1 Tax=Agrotis segetum nucleopolyhedrovirus B TaxID=1580580 RepID=A0A0A7KRK3_9ABAC|nr:p10 [Agrotis segetum nucleopolyhedrovirus B]AIZ48697.1 p10 [Agrotis segetum nucleopolyhedrovirus B]
MSQNIFLLIRSDIAAVSSRVNALQAAIEDVRTNLPDVTELNTKLDAQAVTLDTIIGQVNNIIDVLNPELPDVPEEPEVPEVPEVPPVLQTAAAKRVIGKK